MRKFVDKIDNQGNPIKVGMVKLASPLSENLQSYTNKEGVEKFYHLATGEIELPSGAVTTVTVSIPKANIDKLAEKDSKFEEGKFYLTTLQRMDRKDGEGVITFARMSHLQNAINDESALDELFGAVNSETSKKTVGAEALDVE